jgi:hypothetical protein
VQLPPTCAPRHSAPHGVQVRPELRASALVTSLKVGKGTGKKAELAQLLADRFDTITQAQFEQLKATVQRGAAVSLLPPPSAASLQLPQPPQDPSLLLSCPWPSADPVVRLGTRAAAARSVRGAGDT